MTRITEGHLARHYQGVRGGRDAALLDIAQDHALHQLHNTGLFAPGLVFKGGAALRKFRAGNAGRFSTDLDFAAPDEEVALAALQVVRRRRVDESDSESDQTSPDSSGIEILRRGEAWHR
jgi:uncharacterized protein